MSESAASTISAEQRAELAERICAAQSAALHKLCDYIERELIRARQAAQALEHAPDVVDRETAFARVHEVSTLACVITQTVHLVETPAHVEKWVAPSQAQRVYRAFLSCFRQLQDQQAMTDEQAFEEYRQALSLLGPQPTGT